MKEYRSAFDKKQNLKEGRIYDKGTAQISEGAKNMLSAGSDGAVLPENIGRDLGTQVAIQAVRMYGRGSKEIKEFAAGLISSVR